MVRELHRGWKLDAEGRTQESFRAYSTAVAVAEDGRPLHDRPSSLKVDSALLDSAEPIRSEHFDDACAILTASRQSCVLVMQNGQPFVMQKEDLRPAWYTGDWDTQDRNVA